MKTQQQPRPAGLAEREARVAAALRENLRKRKAQRLAKEKNEEKE
jgi:hypothetical protein